MELIRVFHTWSLDGNFYGTLYNVNKVATERRLINYLTTVIDGHRATIIIQRLFIRMAVSKLLYLAGIDFGIQWALWGAAVLLKTEKFYDLAGKPHKLKRKI